MKKLKMTLILSALWLNVLTFAQNDDFVYYKFDAIKHSEIQENGKYGPEKTEAINVLLKKDNTFKTYTFFYTDSKRNKTAIHFATEKRTKYTFIENSEVSLTNKDVPVINFFNLFMIGKYILNDQLEKQNQLNIFSIVCIDLQPICDYEKQGKISDRYLFTNGQKITKTDFTKLRKGN